MRLRRRIRNRARGTFLVAERTGWDRRLSVSADGKGLIGHAGAVPLRACADRIGLTAGLGRVLPAGVVAFFAAGAAGLRGVV
jgi:hypothetical protein